MTATTFALPRTRDGAAATRKKRVLLVDTSASRRDLRAEAMRKLGMEVDCAADISEARCWWKPDLYNLVLLNVANELGPRNKFCSDLRTATPPQQIAFLVGKPEYLANAPGEEGEPQVEGAADTALWQKLRAALSSDSGNRATAENWGILEACRRISAVRSVAQARSQAMRDRPAPPRDMETQQWKRATADFRTLVESAREELQ